MVLFFPLFWLFNAVVGPNWGAGIAAFAMYIAFPLLALKLWGSAKAEALPSMELALSSGDLLSTEYAVSEAVEVEESEDEGKHFYLAIAPEKTLFLSGQYLYEPVERGVFPSTQIRVFTNRKVGLTYGVECIGEPLQPSRRRPAFSEEQFQRGSVPEDRHLFNCSLSRATAGEV